MRVSLERVRGKVLSAQLLDGRTRLPKGQGGAACTIERLGYIQIDTISVIERAQHHTLRTRLSDCSPDLLNDLQTKDRRVVEYWGHAAFYLPHMRSYQNPKKEMGP